LSFQPDGFSLGRGAADTGSYALAAASTGLGVLLSESDLDFGRLSVQYQPLPLKMMPTELKTR